MEINSSTSPKTIGIIFVSVSILTISMNSVSQFSCHFVPKYPLLSEHAFGMAQSSQQFFIHARTEPLLAALTCTKGMLKEATPLTCTCPIHILLVITGYLFSYTMEGDIKPRTFDQESCTLIINVIFILSNPQCT